MVVNNDLHPSALDAPVVERIKQLDVDHGIEKEERLPPICKVWGWMIYPTDTKGGMRLWCRRFKDHPRLGEGDFLMTSSILWVNHDIGMARTLNTLYKLMPGKEPSDD